jgi:hypothetical protein
MAVLAMCTLVGILLFIVVDVCCAVIDKKDHVSGEED